MAKERINDAKEHQAKHGEFNIKEFNEKLTDNISQGESVLEGLV